MMKPLMGEWMDVSMHAHVQGHTKSSNVRANHVHTHPCSLPSTHPSVHMMNPPETTCSYLIIALDMLKLIYQCYPCCTQWAFWGACQPMVMLLDILALEAYILLKEYGLTIWCIWVHMLAAAAWAEKSGGMAAGNHAVTSLEGFPNYSNIAGY